MDARGLPSDIGAVSIVIDLCRHAGEDWHGEAAASLSKGSKDTDVEAILSPSLRIALLLRDLQP